MTACTAQPYLCVQFGALETQSLNLGFSCASPTHPITGLTPQGARHRVAHLQHGADVGDLATGESSNIRNSQQVWGHHSCEIDLPPEDWVRVDLFGGLQLGCPPHVPAVWRLAVTHFTNNLHNKAPCYTSWLTHRYSAQMCAGCLDSVVVVVVVSTQGAPVHITGPPSSAIYHAV